MKIAMLTTVRERCGIAAYSEALISALNKLPDTQVEVLPIQVGKQEKAHYLEQAKHFNAPDIDVVHIQHEHSFWGGILPGHSAFWEMRYLIQKPVVLTAHTTTTLAAMLRIKTERRPLKRLVKEVLIRREAYRDSIETAPFATAITIVHTAAARNELMARGAKPSYVHIVPTGIPGPIPAPMQGKSFREKYGLIGRRVLTIFGYVTPNKGYELTLNILPALPEDVTLVIAGGTRHESAEVYGAQLEETIARSGLASRVIVTGYLADEAVAEAMQGSDLILVPHTEATGSYSVALPLTQGRPTLASNLACFREIAARLDCLELFNAGDMADYTAKINMLLSNRERREQLAANGVRYAQRYSWPKVAASTRKIYQSAIDIFSESHHGIKMFPEGSVPIPKA